MSDVMNNNEKKKSNNDLQNPDDIAQNTNFVKEKNEQLGLNSEKIESEDMKEYSPHSEDEDTSSVIEKTVEDDYYEKELERLRKEYVGNILDDRYEILEVVGKGGMACVLKALDTTMNRIVAIKILDFEFNEDEAAVERFKNESQAIAMMSHKNIVTVYDVVCHDDMKYIIMEFLHGITFEKYLSRKGKLQWKEACYFMYKILGALEHSHSKGIIHSDVKPQNMMIDKDGEIILTDFGIACLPSDIVKEEAAKKEAFGTAYYMSPEQSSGKPVCEQSDIYSVGVILYEAVAGRLPFDDSDPYVVMEKHISETPVSPATYADDIPDGLVQIITKAMRKNADERYPSAKEMADAIEEISKNPTKTFDGIEIPDIALVDDIKLKERIKELEKKRKAQIRRKKREAKREEKLASPVSRSFFPVITGVCLAFIIVCEAVVGYSLWQVMKRLDVPATLETLFYKENDDDVYIPDYSGKKWSTILEDIEKGELKDKNGKTIVVDPNGITAEYNAEYPAGTIITHEPLGQRVKDNIITSLVISKGSEQAHMPDVRYMSINEAKTVIKDVLGDGVDIKEFKISHEYAHYDQVIKTEPAANELVIKTDGTTSVKVFYCETENASEIKMPDLVGKTYDEAIKELNRYHLILGEITTNETLKEGQFVLEQSIAPYASAMPYVTRVDLTISRQVDVVPMINLVGTTLDEAKKAVKNFGLLNVRFEAVYTSKKDKIIVEQSIPEGENVTASTIITIYYNVHSNTAVVPDVMGKTREEAEAAFEQAGITNVVFTEENSFRTNNTVIYQSVNAGEEILSGAEISVTISVESESVRMDNLEGMTLEEATAWLDQIGIPYTVNDIVDSNKKSGVVVMQTPPHHAYINRGEGAIIYVNKYVPNDEITDLEPPEGPDV